MGDSVRWDFVGPDMTDLEFTIDLAHFKEREPLFAFATCDGHRPEVGAGLALVGSKTFKGELGENEYTLLKVAASQSNGEVKFKFDAEGEYRAEIYHISLTGDATLIFENYFVCK